MSELFVLDTNVVIDLERLRGDVARRLAEKSPQQVAITSMTLSELHFGIIGSAKSAFAQSEIGRLLSGITVLSFGRKEALMHAQLRRQTRSNPIGHQDLIIAATVLANDGTLITANVREFSRVPDLRIENWRT